MATRDARYERIMYPVDWLEERSGLVGGLRYFLFRKVPGDTNWFQTLGSATLTAFLIQALTGSILAMYYKPDPKNAYPSIVHISNDIWGGWLVVTAAVFSFTSNMLCTTPSVRAATGAETPAASVPVATRTVFSIRSGPSIGCSENRSKSRLTKTSGAASACG